MGFIENTARLKLEGETEGWVFVRGSGKVRHRFLVGIGRPSMLMYVCMFITILARSIERLKERPLFV